MTGKPFQLHELLKFSRTTSDFNCLQREAEGGLYVLENSLLTLSRQIGFLKGLRDPSKGCAWARVTALVIVKY